MKAIAAVVGFLAAVVTIVAFVLFVWPQIHPAPPTFKVPSDAELIVQDPLRDNSQGYNWGILSIKDGTCSFHDGGYELTTPVNHGIGCFADSDPRPPADLVIEVKMTVVEGLKSNASGATLVFRASIDTGAGYYYGFNANGDGSFEILDNHGSEKVILAHHSAYYHTGLGEANILDVEVRGTKISLWINGYLFDTATDSTYRSGVIGFDVGQTGGTAPAKVRFTDLTVWRLP